MARDSRSVLPAPSLTDVLISRCIQITSKFYGCGTPIPSSIEGLDILDLGSGSGRDCYLAAALVGEGGSVTGIDMTEEHVDAEYMNDYWIDVAEALHAGGFTHFILDNAPVHNIARITMTFGFYGIAVIFLPPCVRRRAVSLLRTTYFPLTTSTPSACALGTPARAGTRRS